MLKKYASRLSICSMKPSVNIKLKTPEEIRVLKEAGQILAEIRAGIRSSLKIGISTKDIDFKAEQLIQKHKVQSAFKGYRGYPACACVSLNQEVVHGIPRKDRLVKNGDLLSIDIGIKHGRFFSDTAFTVGLGQISQRQRQLIDVTRKALAEGIDQAQIGNHLSDISHAIQKRIEEKHFSVVRDFVGHGIGESLHEEPEIPNFGKPHQGPILLEGMVFAIEPMANIGSWQTSVLKDGWTVVTQDGSCSAHFEHTIAITANGPIILTE